MIEELYRYRCSTRRLGRAACDALPFLQGLGLVGRVRLHQDDSHAAVRTCGPGPGPGPHQQHPQANALYAILNVTTNQTN